MPFHMPAGKCTRSRAWGTQVISKTEFLAELYQFSTKLLSNSWFPPDNFWALTPRTQFVYV